MIDNHLTYFKESEFERNGRNWFDSCHPKLLVLTDVFRRMWGAPIEISPHPKAIGRHDGDSYHNVEQHGWVMALDVMPHTMYDQRRSTDALAIASQIGFGGFGLYPDWEPRPGIHLDIRPRTSKYITKWGGIDVDGTQKYVKFDIALSKFK